MLKEVGRYRIDKFIGSGGMGKVYRAFDPVIGRHVAIKTISLRRYGDADERQNLLERLRREARSAGKLSHTGIVTIHDFIEQGDLACLVMEFIDGVTLRDMLKSQQGVDGRATLSILRQTASALDYAHTGGIVHRDIKPGNIIIQKDGSAKILDFGVAKLSSAHSLTETGFSIGTPEYMSPEQYQGGTLDGRADQFSLGVITYEMLTGVRPFAADTPLRVMYRVMGEEPALAHELNPSLGAEAAEVLRQALSKDPEARFDTCLEFAQMLEKALESSPGWQPMPRSTKGPATPPRVETVEQETPTSTATPDAVASPPSPRPVPGGPPSPRRGTPVRPTPVGGTPRGHPPARPPKKFLAGALGFLAVIGVTVALGLGGLYLFLRDRTPATRPEPQASIEEQRPGPKLEITTGSNLPEAMVGAGYTQSLGVSGGSPPATWSVIEGSPPAGLELDQSSGVLSGEPLRAGSFYFTAQAKDSAGSTAAQAFTLAVRPKPPATEFVFLTSRALPEATEGRPYSQRIVVSGGAPPYRWSARSASLPPGLLLDPSEGTFGGLPARAGRFPFTVQVTDSSEATVSQQFVLNVARAAQPSAPIGITTPAALPPSTAGTEYSQALSASGGRPPYSWSLGGGSLPAGLSLDGARGMISGTPQGPGEFKFSLRVTDSAQAADSRDFVLQVGRLIPRLAITTPGQLPNAAAGVAYTQAVSASGGIPPYQWTVSSGALPAGLALDSGRSLISGTPAAAGEYPFRLRVTDSAQATDTQPMTLRVTPSLVITSPSSLPGGSAGRAYSYELAATGGRPPYQWSLGGSAPPGLSLDASRGVLSGTLTRGGDFRFTVRVTDSARAADTAQLSLSVAAQQGTLTWQGDLPLNVPLIIQGRHASTGSLSGELPGTPVRVEVVEPAGVVIVQMPGTGVGWKNMVLNSPYQRQTRIVIRWTETR